MPTLAPARGHSIAIFRTSPASMAGTVGAILNGAIQLGSAVGISLVSSIESSIEDKDGGPAQYTGRAASFWFLLGVVVVELIAMLVFYRISKEGTAEEHEMVPQGKRADVGKDTSAKKPEKSDEFSRGNVDQDV